MFASVFLLVVESTLFGEEPVDPILLFRRAAAVGPGTGNGSGIVTGVVPACKLTLLLLMLGDPVPAPPQAPAPMPQARLSGLDGRTLLDMEGVLAMLGIGMLIGADTFDEGVGNGKVGGINREGVE